MAITVRQVIRRARNWHMAFSPSTILSSVATEFAGNAERRLIREIHRIDPHYFTLMWGIQLMPQDNAALIGAGSSARAPLEPSATAILRRDANTGSAARPSDDPTVLYGLRAVTSATDLTLLDVTASWAVDAYVGQWVELVDGTGAGQYRVILSNTSDTLTLVSTQAGFNPIPDTTTTYRIIAPLVAVDGSLGVQLGALPASSLREGFLVKLDATGVAYLDLSAPVSVRMTDGIPMPPNDFVDHGTAWASVSGSAAPYRIPVTRIQPVGEFQQARRHSFYIRGQRLYLCPPYEQWSQVRSLEIPYCPIPPALTSENSYFLLPDACEQPLVAYVALQMLERIRAANLAGKAGPGLQSEAQGQLDAFFEAIGNGARGTADQIQDIDDVPSEFGGWLR